jgi:hypothetical protein
VSKQSTTCPAQVEEWKPHPYAEEGVGRKESLKEELPEHRKEPEKKD